MIPSLRKRVAPLRWPGGWRIAKIDGALFLVNYASFTDRVMGFDRNWERAQLAFFLDNVKRRGCEIFLDVGSHIGLYAILVARQDVYKRQVHALSQCRKLIRKLKLKPVVAIDTAGAAAELAKSRDTTVAVIASELAGKIYGLKVLKRNVEDADHNTTRFLIMARKPKPAPHNERRVVTSFVFNVRNVPAALYKAMGGFATAGINMTKLESYMVGGDFTATQFYADVEGHPKSRALQLAFAELKFVTHRLMILGTYPAHPFRDKH